MEKVVSEGIKKEELFFQEQNLYQTDQTIKKINY